VAFTPDGRWLASASDDKTVKLWDASGAEELLTCRGHTDAVTSVTFSRNGRLLASGSRDRTVMIWESRSGRQLFTLSGHEAAVTDVKFSPEGDCVASASEDRSVRLWDTATKHALLTLSGHVGAVSAIAFSPDGRRLASASQDGSVRIWDVASGQEALALRRQFVRVDGIAFCPQGERLIANGTMVLNWEGFRVWETRQFDQDSQKASEELLKADAPQNACFLRGQAHSQSLRWDRAVADYSRAINLGRQDWSVFRARGIARGMLAQYGLAAADFSRAVQANPDEVQLRYNLAYARLGANDLDGYRQECARMREQHGETKVPATATLLLFACDVAESGIDKSDLIRWSRLAVHDLGDARSVGHSLYREGRYAEAIRFLHKWAETKPLRGDDFLFLAMAQQQIGKPDLARKTFAQAVKWIADFEHLVADGGFWYWLEQVEVQYLRRETETLLKIK
jgi:tetratricopeptide (TPR) repeat protein